MQLEKEEEEEDLAEPPLVSFLLAPSLRSPAAADADATAAADDAMASILSRRCRDPCMATAAADAIASIPARPELDAATILSCAGEAVGDVSVEQSDLLGAVRDR